MTLSEFFELSAVLTGVSEKYLSTLPEQMTAEGKKIALGQVYLNRLTATYTKPDGSTHSYVGEFAALEKAWQEAQATADPQAELGKRLALPEAKDLRRAARQVVKIWYLSVIDDPDPANLQRPTAKRDALSGDLGQYQQSIVWDLVKAHVPAYSNLQYGYWAFKPE